MANSYGSWTKDIRRSAQEAWTVSKANLPLTGLDFTVEALEAIMDPENPQQGLTVALPAGHKLGYPNSVHTTENASKIIFADLDDYNTMWDLHTFMQRARTTSWYAELGPPPVHGLMWINEAQSEVVWWNRDKDAVYMRFTAANNNIINNTLASSLAFLDGVLYVGGDAGNGCISIIDFLADAGHWVSTTALNVYSGDIGDRNAGSGYVAYTSSLAIVNGNVKAVAAARDPSLIDEFGRAKQWWYVVAAAGETVFNPVAHATYDLSNPDPVNDMILGPDGTVWSAYDQSVDGDTLGESREIFTINADFNYHYTARYKNLGPWSDPNGTGRLGGACESVLEHGVIAYCNQGIAFLHYEGNVVDSGHGAIFATSSYQTPYMKGDQTERVAAYPLNDVYDRSGNGHTLTNNNSVTFTSGVFGDTATFVSASSQYLQASITNDITGLDFTFSLYYKSSSATNPGSTISIAQWILNGSNPFVSGSVLSDGTFSCTARDQALNGDSVSSTSDIHDAKWHHICVVMNRTAGYLKLYIDGVLVDTNSSLTSTSTFNLDRFAIGGSVGGGQYIDGQVAQYSFSKTAWTENEVALEYARMVRGANASFTTLQSDAVDSVRVDPDTGMAIVCNGGKAQVWDATLGLGVSADDAPAGTLRDADLKTMNGADVPHYAMGTSTRVELVQGETRIGG